MKKLSKLFLFSMLTVLGFSCGDDDGGTIVDPPKTESELTGSIKANTTLKSNIVYTLKGYVEVEEGYTLTIEPGTIIKGDQASKGTLIIKRGAKIVAEGTKEKPIVFTSAKAKGSRAPGDWGGIMICGKAKQNQGANPIVEGGPTVYYGGEDDADNSGVLKYVRIEFAGIPLQPAKEINGLTMYAVGSGTTIQYVQVSFGGDDAFEWFGGTVSPKYLIAYKTTDDMFDTDFGFSGKVQYVLGVSDPAISDAAGASNGFESDNDNNGSVLVPLTTGMFANATIVGPMTAPANSYFGQGAHLKKATSLSIFNSVITGWAKGITLDGTKVEEYATAGGIQIKNTVIAGATSPLNKTSTNPFDPTTWYSTAGNNNEIKANHADLGLGAAPPYLPQTGSVLLTGAANVAGFENTTFRGAFGTTDWTAGWANFDPQNADY